MAQVWNPRLILWMLLISILIAVFGFHWSRVEKEAEHTAFSVVVNQINQRANRYRQLWLVEKQPASMEIEGQVVQFDKNGWVTPLRGNTVDCSWWFETLFPNVNRGYVTSPEVTLISDSGQYVCRYQFSHHYQIELALTDRNLSISVGKLADAW